MHACQGAGAGVGWGHGRAGTRPPHCYAWSPPWLPSCPHPRTPTHPQEHTTPPGEATHSTPITIWFLWAWGWGVRERLGGRREWVGWIFSVSGCGCGRGRLGGLIVGGQDQTHPLFSLKHHDVNIFKVLHRGLIIIIHRLFSIYFSPSPYHHCRHSHRKIIFQVIYIYIAQCLDVFLPLNKTSWTYVTQH